MALFKCPDCGREVSDKAKVCPGCGRPIESQRKRNSIFLNIIAFGILAVSVFLAKDSIGIKSIGVVELLIVLGVSGVVIVLYYAKRR